MVSNHRGVFARALMAAIAALALLIGLSSAASANDDALPSAAAQALTDLQTAQVDAASASAGGLPIAEAAASSARYEADLAAVAELVAPRTSVAQEDFVAAWHVAGAQRMTVLLSALAQVGVRYRY